MGTSGRYGGWVSAGLSGEGTLSIGNIRVRTGAGSIPPSAPIHSGSLLASARRHASRGMRARAADEHDDAALQLGIMLEHLAKAYLARLHPTLLIDVKFDLLSLVDLAGQGHQLTTPHVLKTVGLQGALERIGTIQAGGAGGAGAIFARRFDAVMRARNGVAHIGDQGGGADEVAQLAVRGADEILSMMGEDLHEVFGDYTDAAVSLLDEASTAVEQVITLRLGHARQFFAIRVADFTEAEREEELAALDRLTMLQAEEDDRKVALGCPACERIGLLTGSPYLEMQPGEHFVDADGSDKVLVAIKVRLSADGFRCPACSLRLYGPEQLREVPLPTQALVRIGTHEDLATFGEEVRIIENGDSADESE